MYRLLFSFSLVLHEFHIFFLTMNYIIAISNKVSIEYINISDIKESTTIGMTSARGIAWDDNTVSASPDCFITPSFKIDFLECAGRL